MAETDDRWVMLAVERYQQPLLRYATSLVGPSQAADVVQDVFLELCRQQPAQVEGHLAAWLFTVARNRSLDLCRRAGRAASLPEGDDMPSPDSGPQAKLERHQTLSRLMTVVEGLPEREREAVRLKFSGGLSYQEIADCMSLSVSNVGFILHTAMQTIRAELGNDRRAR
jgi:RNA polymerase sigma factor (sigma-70 family)